MQEYDAGRYDVAVVGAGHAGIEAGLASARLGCSTCVFTINMDWVGNMPCNPSIGGTAKGHLVREIDALGGEMGKAADACFLQSRMLNRGKGPAVHSLRAQIDRREYAGWMKHRLETTPNLDLKQAELIDLRRLDDGNWQVITRLGAVYTCRAVIIATGTFLGGRIFVGEASWEGGPDGMFPAKELSVALKRLGVSLRRFKTGTPARVHRASVDLDQMEAQPGEDPVVPFSFETEHPGPNRVLCHITWTNEQTKQVILGNLHRSPLYGGKIEGIGPRYCPSIEDKIVRFADKPRHQIFVEPCGLNTEELYLQGMSSSLPEEVQLKFLRTVKGLEHVKIMRTAYAIEYDCVDPLQLRPTLEFLDFPGLYGAGQFNGSSGYEEAAAQGLVAGVNAALKLQGRPPMVLDRASSYIGTLIDDLVTKGTEEPYRMMTSRSEYRLVLRQDNADQRLTAIGHRIGLVSEERLAAVEAKYAAVAQEIRRLEHTGIPGSEALNALLTEQGTTPVNDGCRLIDLLRRPQVSYNDLRPFDPAPQELAADVVEQVEITVKYEGYIQRQQNQVAEFERLEQRLLPEDLDYGHIQGLRLEAREKLSAIRPRSLGQAGRISGVSPADMAALMIYLGK